MMNMAILAVGYSRPRSLSRLLASLTQAKYDGEKVALIISLDKGDNREVEKAAAEYVWPFGEKHVVIQPQRLGLRKHRPEYMLIETNFRDEIEAYLCGPYEAADEFSHHDILYRRKEDV